MDLYIKNEVLETVAIIDNASSVIWTKRYYESGDFEVYILANENTVKYLKKGYYIQRQDDSMVGIIEKIELKTDIENGNYLTVSGRDLKSLLARRIVWKQTKLSGTVENCLRRLVTENVIETEISERKISNFTLGELNGFTETMKAQMTGKNLLEAISDICKTYNYGFDILLTSDNKFEFNIMKGTDRSVNQNENPVVVFSSDFDNLISTDYCFDNSELKNVALIMGEGEGINRKNITLGNFSGIERRELYVDARDLSRNEGTEDEISEEDYLHQLAERGNEKLSEVGIEEKHEAQIELSDNYVYKVDFDIGDIVTIISDYGFSSNCRIIEMIECEDENGRSLIPKLES